MGAAGDVVKRLVLLAFWLAVAQLVCRVLGVWEMASTGAFFASLVIFGATALAGVRIERLVGQARNRRASRL